MVLPILVFGTYYPEHWPNHKLHKSSGVLLWPHNWQKCWLILDTKRAKGFTPNQVYTIWVCTYVSHHSRKSIEFAPNHDWVCFPLYLSCCDKNKRGNTRVKILEDWLMRKKQWFCIRHLPVQTQKMRCKFDWPWNNEIFMILNIPLLTKSVLKVNKTSRHNYHQVKGISYPQA